MTQQEIRSICYEKFGGYSKLALSVLFKAKNFSNIHDLCKSTGISFKLVKDVLCEFASFDGEEFTLNKQLDLSGIYQNLEFSEIEKYESDIENIISLFKFHNKSLDHVSATARTLIKRVWYIFNNVDTNFCKILFLGDHDFTSISLAYILNKLNLNYSICVVDIDDNVLDFICENSDKFNLNITALYSDVRLGVPINYCNTFDLIFSDPPYTPEGMSLFLKRAIECAKNKYASIYLCYKTAELSASVGLKVQKELLKNHIYFRAILPNFNDYTGAEALGYRSDLYICSLTPKSFDNIDTKNPYDIYTHGNNSIEAKNCVNINYGDIVDILSKKTNIDKNLIKIISNNKFNADNSILVDVFYKQKRNKNTNYPKESIFVFDFTYQNIEVLNLRSFIMSDKKVQYGIFLNSQIEALKSEKYKTILSLFDIKQVYKDNDCLIYSFANKIDDLSIKIIMLYKNSNLKNAYVSCITQDNKTTKNQAREKFMTLKIAKYADSMVFDLPLYELNKLYSCLE